MLIFILSLWRIFVINLLKTNAQFFLNNSQLFFLTFTAVMAESSYHKISCENESNAKKTFLTRLINSLEVFTQENLKVDRKIVVLKNSFCSCKVRVMSQVATELWQ